MLKLSTRDLFGEFGQRLISCHNVQSHFSGEELDWGIVYDPHMALYMAKMAKICLGKGCVSQLSKYKIYTSVCSH